jgi:hypothetical protein
MGFGEIIEKTVRIPAASLQSVNFNEWTGAEVAEETPGPCY